MATSTMSRAEDMSPWYELRDRLRGDFIRCMEEERSFPRARRRLLDRVEDVVTQMELQKRLNQPKESATAEQSTSHPHRDALERTFINTQTRVSHVS